MPNEVETEHLDLSSGTAGSMTGLLSGLPAPSLFSLAGARSGNLHRQARSLCRPFQLAGAIPTLLVRNRSETTSFFWFRTTLRLALAGSHPEAHVLHCRENRLIFNVFKSRRGSEVGHMQTVVLKDRAGMTLN